MAPAAAVAAALANQYRLLIALITAETAALLGLGGAFVSAVFDGCIPPLNTLRSSCQVGLSDMPNLRDLSGPLCDRVVPDGDDDRRRSDGHSRPSVK